MINFSLKQLRYALAIADAGHFGRAAQAVHVTQPALSQQIRQLEDACGALLFDRGKRVIRQTPFGRDFLDRARLVVAAADNLGAFALSQKGPPQTPLRFGLIPTIAPYLLPAILPALGSELPELDFIVSESQTEHLLSGLESGDVDLALIATAPPPTGPALTVAPLFADPFVLATSTAATFAEPVEITTLPRDQILLLDEGHCFRDQAIKACALRGERAASSFAATSLSTIVEFVANGQGVTLLPAISLGKEAANPRIKLLSLAAPGASRQLSLVWRRTTPFAKLFGQIADVVRRASEPSLARPLKSQSVSR